MRFQSVKSANKRKISFVIAAMVAVGVVKFGSGLAEYSACIDEKDPSVPAKSTNMISQVQTYSVEDVYVEDDTLYEGDMVVVKSGKPGVKEEKLEITYDNGDVSKINVLDTNIISEAAPKEIHVGTKERPNFILPVDNYNYTYGVGYREDGFHTGMDLMCPDGTNVKCAADGVVIFADWESSYGMVVFVQHDNNIITAYAHMSAISVTEGQEVKQGESLGLSGSTGNVTAPHVHMEFWENNAIINPVEKGYVNP